MVKNLNLPNLLTDGIFFTSRSLKQLGSSEEYTKPLLYLNVSLRLESHWPGSNVVFGKETASCKLRHLQNKVFVVPWIGRELCPIA